MPKIIKMLSPLGPKACADFVSSVLLNNTKDLATAAHLIQS